MANENPFTDEIRAKEKILEDLQYKELMAPPTPDNKVAWTIWNAGNINVKRVRAELDSLKVKAAAWDAAAPERAKWLENEHLYKMMQERKLVKPLKDVKYYGWTWTVPKDLGFEKGVEVLRRSLEKLKNQRQFNMVKFFGGWEAHKSGMPHLHIIIAADVRNGQYPNQGKIGKMHPHGMDWCKQMGQPARWQNYILMSCKDKIKLGDNDTSYFGEQMSFDEKPVEGEDT